MVKFIFTRSTNALIDKPIRAWEGDTSSHVSIQIGNSVYDATLWHGVSRRTYEEWSKNKIITEAYSVDATETRILGLVEWLNDLVEKKTKYDVFKIIGFLLLRDIDSYNKFICSELVIKSFTLLTDIKLPGRQGRQGVRLAKNAISIYCDTVSKFNRM